MNPLYYIILTTIITSFLSCNNETRENSENKDKGLNVKKTPELKKNNHDNTRFPEVKKLTEFKRTDFLPTLEHNISSNKNAIYSAALLFAWDEIRKRINQPIEIKNSYTSLTLLNNSKSFANVLDKNEFNASGDIDGEVIRASAEFSKSLPFEFKLTSFTNELIFDGKKVESFGQIGYDYKTAGIIQILYYKNDDNFIIKLSPKNIEHEIILFKSSDTYKSMSNILDAIVKKVEIGKIESQSNKTSWRYYLTNDDDVIIPKIKFNIETNDTTLEGKSLMAGNREYLIEKTYQRTAFNIDESGAEIESEAYLEAAAAETEATKPQPKKMRFDKPFFLMLKRIDNNNPYFGLYVNNTELLLSENNYH